MADGYQGRIRGAAVLSFLKSFCAKAPFVVAFFMISAFLDGTVTKTTCVFSGIALVACIIVQSLLQNAADRLQSAAGFEIFADKRKQLGSHLRKLPMGYFTEGNIGKSGNQDVYKRQESVRKPISATAQLRNGGWPGRIFPSESYMF